MALAKEGNAMKMPGPGRPIPRDWEISPDWMTAVLQRHHSGAQVSEVRRVGGSDGTSSRAVFELEYAAGAGPRRVFAKTKGDPLRRVFQWMTDNAFIEGRLVQSAVDLPIEHPTLYYGAIDRLRLNDVIVMEDVLQRGARLNDANRPLSVEEVSRGLRGLAAMHSRFWGLTDTTAPDLAWVRPWRASRTFSFLIRLGCSRGLPRLAGHVPNDVVELGTKGLVSYWQRHVRSVSNGPQTLLHGDAHVGNCYTLPDGDVGFFDWGVMRRGHWSFDVSYFVVSALSVEDRREHAAALVEEYRTALEIPDSARPSADEAWLRFRAATPYGLAIWITTGAEDNYQAPEICQNLAGQFGQAFVDLDTPSAMEAFHF